MHLTNAPHLKSLLALLYMHQPQSFSRMYLTSTYIFIILIILEVVFAICYAIKRAILKHAIGLYMIWLKAMRCFTVNAYCNRKVRLSARLCTSNIINHNVRDKSDSSSRSSHCLLMNVTNVRVPVLTHTSLICFQPSWPQFPVPEIIALKQYNSVLHLLLKAKWGQLPR